MSLYEAPPRASNHAGDRSFAYLAEVDILGWKFRKMKDGAFVIDTPLATKWTVGGNFVAVLPPDMQELLVALMALRPGETSTTPSEWSDVGA